MNIRNRFQNGFPSVEFLISIPEFQCFMSSCGGTRGNSRTTKRAIIKFAIHLNRGIPTGIENLAGMEGDDYRHATRE